MVITTHQYQGNHVYLRDDEYYSKMAWRAIVSSAQAVRVRSINSLNL